MPVWCRYTSPVLWLWQRGVGGSDESQTQLHKVLQVSIILWWAPCIRLAPLDQVVPFLKCRKKFPEHRFPWHGGSIIQCPILSVPIVQLDRKIEVHNVRAANHS